MCYVCIEWYDKYILVVCDEDTIMIRQIGAFYYLLVCLQAKLGSLHSTIQCQCGNDVP